MAARREYVLTHTLKTTRLVYVHAPTMRCVWIENIIVTAVCNVRAHVVCIGCDMAYSVRLYLVEVNVPSQRLNS